MPSSIEVARCLSASDLLTVRESMKSVFDARDRAPLELAASPSLAGTTTVLHPVRASLMRTDSLDTAMVVDPTVPTGLQGTVVFAVIEDRGGTVERILTGTGRDIKAFLVWFSMLE